MTIIDPLSLKHKALKLSVLGKLLDSLLEFMQD